MDSNQVICKSIHNRKKDGDNDDNKNNPNKAYERRVFEFGSDYDLWNFLKINKDIISGIKDWRIYSRVVESIKERFIDNTLKPISNEKLLHLLKKGDIPKFVHCFFQTFKLVSIHIVSYYMPEAYVLHLHFFH